MLDFAVIGAAKSGTSTLRAALDAHPQLFCARETHFFCERFARGTAWYEEQLAAAEPGAKVGEKCPDYLPNPVALERLAAYSPRTKLIVSLRDPVARAYSHYWHDRRGSGLRASFEEAIADGTYVSWGQYVTQLETVVGLVPSDQLLVVLFEDLEARPDEVFARACRFLEVDHALRPVELHQRRNPYRQLRHPRRWSPLFRFHLWERLPAPAARRLWQRMERQVTNVYPDMADATRRKLVEHFHGWNARLEAWLERELPPERRPRDLDPWIDPATR